MTAKSQEPPNLVSGKRNTCRHTDQTVQIRARKALRRLASDALWKRGEGGGGGAEWSETQGFVYQKMPTGSGVLGIFIF